MSVQDSVKRISASFEDDTLLDAALDDRELPTARRVLAGIAIGRPVDDSFHALVDLHRAVEIAALDDRDRVDAEERTGVTLLEHILAQPSDHYLRAVWYSVADLGHVEAAAHLAWLVELLHARGGVVRLAQAAGRPVLHRSQDGFGGDAGAPVTSEPVEVITGSLSAPSPFGLRG